MQKKKKWMFWLKMAICILPYIAGVAGLLMDKGADGSRGITDAFFLPLTMYTLNFGEWSDNILVNFARWLAPVGAAVGLAQAYLLLRMGFHNLLAYRYGNSTAIYGPEADKVQLEAQLGRCMVRVKDFEDLQRADRYVLLGSEEENITFLQQFSRQLEGKDVYMRSENWPPQMVRGERLHVFSAEETAARVFWQEESLTDAWLAAEKAGRRTLKVAMLGFGRLGEELLNWGLQVNIFHPQQKIEYHVFPGAAAAEMERYLLTHHELGKISDPVIVHSGDWEAETALLADADRIIICAPGQEEKMAQTLLLCLPAVKAHVFAQENTLLERLDGENSDRLHIFLWKREALRIGHLFNDDLLELAKRIHLRYEHIYHSAAETPENMEAEWNHLSSFTRYSNINCADYHGIRLQLLTRGAGYVPGQPLSEEEMARQAELEHIRWCRYHYLNNWTYVAGEKNSLLRTHPLLRPFDTLTAADKKKDAENVRLSLALCPGDA